MATAQPKNYRELYGNVAPIDAKRYLEFMAVATTPSPGLRVTRFVNSSDSLPKMLLYVAKEGSRHVVRYLHRLFVCPESMFETSVWDDKVFAFHSDISARSSTATILQVEDPFHLISASVRVPTIDLMNDVWAAQNVNADCIEPLQTPDVSNETVKTRRCMAVPAQLVVQIMERQARTMKEFWDDICQPLVANNYVDDYEVFLDWARVACTYSSPNTNALLNGTPTIPLADEKLYDRAHEVVHSDLPGLRQAPTPGGPAAGDNQIANAIRAAARPAKKGLSPVSEKFAGTIEIIRSITGVEHEANFPPFWIKFANASKAERATVYETAARLRANGPGGNGSYAPPSPHLLEVLSGARFASSKHDDLTQGLSIFALPNSLHDTRENQRRTQMYQSVYAGHGAPSMSDLLELSSTKVVVPRSCSQYMMQVGSYSTLWDVLKGPDNVAAKALQTHVSDVSRVMIQIEDKFMDSPEKLTTILGQLMYKTHVAAMVYFDRRVSTPWDEVVRLPRFRNIIEIVLYDEYSQLPPMPMAALKPAKEKKRTPANPSTATAPEPSKEKKERVAVKNTAPNEALMTRFKNSGKPLKDLYQDTTVTKPFVDGKSSKRENQLCFNYHLGGECHEDCWRKASHRPQSATELSGFCQYLTDVGVPN